MSLFPRVGPTRVGLTIDDLGRVRSCNARIRVGHGAGPECRIFLV